ncbi:Co-chaperone protein p23-1 [Sesamum angolense]|uniref:Co-chaperone protein p23 n=1 Tax=Sesamum angolense TaxID=2727404 RepID=A0AAE1W6M3_9LAMI|nr:Co-chaperone protein p23-1 [Sesamum angolense]
MRYFSPDFICFEFVFLFALWEAVRVLFKLFVEFLSWSRAWLINREVASCLRLITGHLWDENISSNQQMGSLVSRHPLVKWAQRSDKLFITVELPDAENVKLNLDPEGKFFFSATSGADNTPYEIDIDLYDKVDVNRINGGVGFSSRGKPPVFVKVDWDKWVDEDEQDEKSGGDMDFGDFDFSKLNMGGPGDFDAEAADADEDDSSDTDEETKEETAPANGKSEEAPASSEPAAKA